MCPTRVDTVDKGRGLFRNEHRGQQRARLPVALVLLSAVSRREDCAVELAPNLKGDAAHKVDGKLLTEGLVEEIPARGALPDWRRDEEEGALALRITRRGLTAIQVEEGGALPQAEEPRDTEQGAARTGDCCASPEDQG
jgi:hypothetical protein